MTKIKLYSIGNEENFNYYVFDKKQKVAEYLSMISHKVLGIYLEFDNPENTKKINIEKYKDYHEGHSSTEKVRLDIFYGDKKMFVTIICSKKDRLRLNEELFKIAEMPKPKK
jgi:hypothetical protein